MRAFKRFPKREKDLTIDLPRNVFCLLGINAQMLDEPREKILRMGKAEHDISGFFGKKSDLLHRKGEFFAHLENAFRVLHAHHGFFQRLGEPLKMFFNFLRGVGGHSFLCFSFLSFPRPPEADRPLAEKRESSHVIRKSLFTRVNLYDDKGEMFLFCDGA